VTTLGQTAQQSVDPKENGRFSSQFDELPVPVAAVRASRGVILGEVGLTTAILCFVFAVWPLIAFLGGLAFSPW